nr:DUF305 domain-containing protein [Micromonospora sp. DSM 115978]
MKRLIATVCVAVVAPLTGCGADPSRGSATPSALPPAPVGSPGAPADGAFNATDVMFLQMMLEQHAIAAELLRLAAERARTPEVTTLAAAIDVTQRTETDTMTRWLRDWGQPLTVDPAAHQAHDAHGGHQVLRGATAADVELLRSTGAAEFERTFLNILIAHQHNAVELARMENAGGVHPEVRELARRVDLSRTGQIQQMLPMAAG